MSELKDDDPVGKMLLTFLSLGKIPYTYVDALLVSKILVWMGLNFSLFQIIAGAGLIRLITFRATDKELPLAKKLESVIFTYLHVPVAFGMLWIWKQVLGG